jgi:hypothetical protein
MLKPILHSLLLEEADSDVGLLGVANVTGHERLLMLFTKPSSDPLKPFIQGRACPLLLPAAT